MSIKTEMSKYIANKIIESRESVGWSQSELSRRAGVTSAAISQLEKGSRLPSLIVLRKLSKAFNVSISELIGESISSPNDEAKNFFRNFKGINDLNKSDQKIIQYIVKRLTKNEHQN